MKRFVQTFSKNTGRLSFYRATPIASRTSQTILLRATMSTRAIGPTEEAIVAAEATLERKLAADGIVDGATVDAAPVFERLRNGEAVPFGDEEYVAGIPPAGRRAAALVAAFNAAPAGSAEAAAAWRALTGQALPEGTRVSAPLWVNIGRFTRLGRNVFVNHAVSLLDMGGIEIGDRVLIGPQARLLTEGHPIAPSQRHSLTSKSIRICENAWIGAGATVLGGVTVGRNSIVAAGAVVTRDVPENTVVAGVPAKVIKQITEDDDPDLYK